MVTRVVPGDRLMEATRELASKIAKGPPITMALTKRAIYKGVVHDLETQLDFESYGQNLCRGTEDHREGVMAFMEKREPVFKGL